MVFNHKEQPQFDKSAIKGKDLGALTSGLYILREEHGVDVGAQKWGVRENYSRMPTVLFATIDGSDYVVDVKRKMGRKRTEQSHTICLYKDKKRLGEYNYP